MRTAAIGLVLWCTACGSQDAGDSAEAGSVSGPGAPSTGEVTGTTSETGAPTSGSEGSSSGSAGSASSSDGTTGTTGMTGEPVCAGVLPEHWIDGTDCASEPQLQIHAYDDRTTILRQSLCTSFEAPFMYLLFGSERALLLDTGDGGIPIADVVRAEVDTWAAAHGLAKLELVVANTHGHGDHIAGNEQFVGLADTQLVGVGPAAVAAFFGITDWPTQSVTFDLGGRVLDIVPIPGHEPAHIAVFDRDSGLLLTGDTLYPGRLYVADFPAYVASIGRLADHVAGQEVCHVLGAHIEMTTTPGDDFEFMQAAHPDEHALELDLDHLLELRAAVEAMTEPTLEVHDDFIVYPL